MQAADAGLGEAGLAGPGAAGLGAASAAAGGAADDPATLPDTGLRSHSLACLLHWCVVQLQPSQNVYGDAYFAA